MPGAIDRLDVTGLVLAGGRGTRMGSVDKGLVPYRGKPMAQHAVERLAPQVGGVLVNANRHLERYEAMGFTVCPDLLADFPGPLAGLQAGLARCVTPYLATVPCDSPLFPFDLVERLCGALREADAEIALVQTTEEGRAQAQPVFLLTATALRSSLHRFLLEGGRRIDRWAAGHRRVDVPFDDAAAFANANSPDDLARLERRLD